MSSGQSIAGGSGRRGFLGTLGGAAAASLTLGAAEPFFGSAELGAEPLLLSGGTDRLSRAYAVRMTAANRMKAFAMPDQRTNGDEGRLPRKLGTYSKGLPHDALGEVDDSAYGQLRAALDAGDPDMFEAITLGSGGRTLTNPLAGLAFDLEGLDAQQFTLPPAPSLVSAEAAAEMVELYWMALLRDVSFEEYDTHPAAAAAAAELTRLPRFRGPRRDGSVTPQTLFRDGLPGALRGPYLSQFLWLRTPFGAELIDRRIVSPAPAVDHGLTFDHWLAIQNGHVPGTAQRDTRRRYLRNGRDLAQWVHIDVLFQAYFNACLILGTPPADGGIGCAVNPTNPYVGSTTQSGFGTWGGPFFKTLMCEVATRALKAAWFQKWFVHRRLRPEAYAGRVHVHRAGRASYPLHADVLNSQVLEAIRVRNGGTWLLPLAYPEGSPTHPAYAAGHATVAGACVTILKALFDERVVIESPVLPSPDGTSLGAYTGPELTVGGELNKLASNVATGRNIGGVHWRSDARESLKLGERVAIEILRDTLTTCSEPMPDGLRFTGFDGAPVHIVA